VCCRGAGGKGRGRKGREIGYEKGKRNRLRYAKGHHRNNMILMRREERAGAGQTVRSDLSTRGGVRSGIIEGII
jgi:hypothetical protein